MRNLNKYITREVNKYQDFCDLAESSCAVSECSYEFKALLEDGKILGCYIENICVGLVSMVPRKKIYFSFLSLFRRDMILFEVKINKMYKDALHEITGILFNYAIETSNELGYKLLCIGSSHDKANWLCQHRTKTDGVFLTEMERSRGIRELPYH